jgi:hypothetical protein
MDGRLIFRHHLRRLDAFRDAGSKVSGPLDVAVPQGRGHIRFRSHRTDRQEKPEGYKAGARTKTDTGRRDEDSQALERTLVKELGKLTP